MGLIGAFPQDAAPAEQITEEITTSGTWTVPEGVTEIEVRLFGGGGGGSTCGGGGGYGPLKLAEDGRYKNYSSNPYSIGGRGGLGYGAGGGGGAGVGGSLPGAGAPGICVITYQKGGTA